MSSAALAVTFPPPIEFDSISAIHQFWGWFAIGALGLAGLFGLALAIMRKEPTRTFWWTVGVAIVVMLGQIGMGLWMFSVDEIEPGNQHLFYGVVTLFAFSFAYIYRPQFAKRPTLSYGLLLLFVMGLGIRGILTFGLSFGS